MVQVIGGKVQLNYKLLKMVCEKQTLLELGGGLSYRG